MTCGALYTTKQRQRHQRWGLGFLLSTMRACHHGTSVRRYWRALCVRRLLLDAKSIGVQFRRLCETGTKTKAMRYHRVAVSRITTECCEAGDPMVWDAWEKIAARELET